MNIIPILPYFKGLRFIHTNYTFFGGSCLQISTRLCDCFILLNSGFAFALLSRTYVVRAIVVIHNEVKITGNDHVISREFLQLLIDAIEKEGQSSLGP